MLMHKQAHGSGVDLDFPDANQIEEAIVGYDIEHMVQVYGDGSYTTPTKLWAALGGFGAWLPDWNHNAETIEAREEKNHSGAALAQTGSSTRQELTAWILVLAMSMRTMYATDSASMLAKPKMLLKAAKLREEIEAQGKKAPSRNPFRKPWASKRMETSGSKLGKQF